MMRPFDRKIIIFILLLLLLNLGLIWQNEEKNGSLSPQAQKFGQLDSRDLLGEHAIVYTAVDPQSGLDQLFAVFISTQPPITITQPPRQLTQSIAGIWDFAAAPNQAKIAISLLTSKGTSDLWQVTPFSSTVDILTVCPDGACSSMAWSPDGNFLAFSKHSASSGGSAMLNPPRLWLLNLFNGETAPIFSDSQKLSFEPRWSYDSQWLSYVSPDLGGVGVINLQYGRTQFYETPTGEAAAWNSKANQLVFTVMQQQGDMVLSHLVLADVATNQQKNLSFSEHLVEDSSAVWSPDGEWLAFRRRIFKGEGATMSKQLWRMRKDGSDVKPLTNEPEFEHGTPAWSPDGRFLVFHKFPLKGPNIVLSIWVLDVEGG